MEVSRELRSNKTGRLLDALSIRLHQALCSTRTKRIACNDQRFEVDRQADRVPEVQTSEDFRSALVEKISMN